MDRIEVTQYGYTRPPLEDWEIERERLLDVIVAELRETMGEAVTREQAEEAMNNAGGPLVQISDRKPLPAMNRADRRALAKAARRAS